MQFDQAANSAPQYSKLPIVALPKKFRRPDPAPSAGRRHRYD